MYRAAREWLNGPWLGGAKAQIDGYFRMAKVCRTFSSATAAAARKVLDWPKICKLPHAFLWEHRYKR